MNWSLSEYLNLIELRGQSWCFIDLARLGGIRVPHNEAILFHAVLAGTVRIVGVGGQPIELHAGDIVMILSGAAHAMRDRPDSPTALVGILTKGEYVDAPPTVSVGHGPAVARLLSGRLKVRWPGGAHPGILPPALTLRAADSGIALDSFVGGAGGAGAAAVLTRLATLLFVRAFRDHPRCQALFALSLDDPISRARQFVEKHPFQPWTVAALARKVGMGRSNFAARFTEQVGMTPIDALTEERMKLAQALLRDTDLKIAEICERVGYRSEAAFIRRFTSRFGSTPGALRRQTAG